MEPRAGIASPANRPKRWLVEVNGSGGLALWPKALPIERTVETVSLVSPSRVSAMRGIKSIPAEWTLRGG